MLYLIQKHNATHLHYDLRLEMDGKLRSWAIPKTPPTEKGIKRLAIQTEDHSVEYEDFEGIISDEDSGDGSVEIWDKGTYDIKENKDDKRRRPYRTKKPSNLRDQSVSQQKKAHKDFHKKMEKSKKTW